MTLCPFHSSFQMSQRPIFFTMLLCFLLAFYFNRKVNDLKEVSMKNIRSDNKIFTRSTTTSNYDDDTINLLYTGNADSEFMSIPKVQDNEANQQCIPQSTDILIVGAGLSGAVIAEHYARILKQRVLIIDKRLHIGGNCHDYIDEETGILVNTYGLHMFHTKREVVMEYMKRFGEFARWDHQTLGYVDGKFVPIPVNIVAVNSLFDLNISSEDEMNAWSSSVQEKDKPIEKSEDMAISRVGRHLYEIIFLPYTLKQWDKHPRDLGPEVTARIPVYSDTDMHYFRDKYQALPVKGYTALFENMLLHDPLIQVCTGVDYFDFETKDKLPDYKHLYFTGPTD
jgi:UDP-galactopyranose mutase